LIKHDVTAGLFVPVELLLVGNKSGEGSSIIYVLPSSLMATGNAELTKAAKALDAKLERWSPRLCNHGPAPSQRRNTRADQPPQIVLTNDRCP
jgi:hypothetical protein